jgi:hypothetical protein
MLLWRIRRLEDDSHELLMALRLSVEHLEALPSVKVVSEASLSLTNGRGGQRHAVLPQLEIPGYIELDAPALEMIFEPDSQEQGFRHVAPLEVITIADSHSPAQAGLNGDGLGEDFFGAPTPEDRRALDELTRSRGGAGADDLPPIDFLLGNDTGGLAGLLAGGERSSIDGGTPKESIRHDSTGLGPENTEGVVGTPETPSRVLNFSPLARTSGQAVDDGQGESERRRRSEELFRMIDSHSPQTAGAGDAVADGNRTADIHADGSEAAAMPVDEMDNKGEFSLAGAAVDGQPRRKRQRRLPRWYDDKTELPDRVYKDASAITRNPIFRFEVFLPHVAPHVPYTTTFSDMAPALGDFFAEAREVGKRRRTARAAERRAQREALQSEGLGSAARAAGSGTGDMPMSTDSRQPAPSPATRPTVSPPVDSMAADEHMAPHLPTEARTQAQPDSMEVDDLAEVSGANDQLSLGFESERKRGRLTPGDQPATGSRRSPQEGPHTGAAEIDAGFIASEEPMAEGEDGGFGSPELLVKLENIEDHSPSSGVARDQEDIIQESLGSSPGAAMSFFAACKRPPEGELAAAQRFTQLLSMHMDGRVSLSQAEPFSDILITRGPDWIDA